MEIETSVGTNGVSGYPPPVDEGSDPIAEAVLSPLEIEIDAMIDAVTTEIARMRSVGSMFGQRFDVAARFLADARSLARDGKTELAERKFAAAKNVLNGGKSE
jgi:hypothetical protein